MRLTFACFALYALLSSIYAKDFPRDCQVSNWTDWSPCNGWCKTELSVPVRVRFRQVTVYPTLNGTKCPHLSEWLQCNEVSNCPYCNCLGCGNGVYPPGSQSWCTCCESGMGSGCNCANNTYNYGRCIDQGWGTTYCQGYVIRDRARNYCRSHNFTADLLKDILHKIKEY